MQRLKRTRVTEPREALINTGRLSQSQAVVAAHYVERYFGHCTVNIIKESQVSVHQHVEALCSYV